jgi:uncharacterized protein YbcI
MNLNKPVIAVLLTLAVIGLAWFAQGALSGANRQVQDAQDANEVIEQTRERVDEIEQEAQDRLEQLP